MLRDWPPWTQSLNALRSAFKRIASWRASDKQSLAGRLAAMLLLGMLVIFAIAMVGLWWTSSRLLEDSLKKQALQWIAELDELGTPQYAARGGRHLAAIDRRLKNFPEIAFVRYYDPSGERVIGAYGVRAAESAPALTAEQLSAAREPPDADAPYFVGREQGSAGGQYLRIIAPVRVKSIAQDGAFGFRFEGDRRENVRVIGYIDLGIDAAYYRKEFGKSIAFGSSVIAAMLLLALLAGRWLMRRWLAPLAELRVPLERLAQGDTSVQVESRSGHAEIAAIGDAVKRLQRLADHDPLTGLANRTHFARVMELELQRLGRAAGRSALYFVDLDQFKYVNDTLGHAVGDRLLVQVAELLRRRLRETDVISRFGGDEFTVLARDVSPVQAAEMAELINRLVQEARIAEGGRVFTTSCSIGIAMLDGAVHSVTELLAQADMACYAAKSSGRNSFRLYESGNAENLRMGLDFSQSQLIKQAIREDRFQLLYQPMVGLKRADRMYYEVLLRMQGPDAELVLPASFLPAAQHFGLLVDIDHWVIEHSLRALAEFRRRGRDVGFSINLSGQSFEDRSLFGFIQDQLTRNEIAGDKVMFEITEQTAVCGIDRAQQLIQGLMRSGCHIALDDFGAGFSSFSYLKNLPVDFIKIDGSFVQNMAADALDQAMVRSIIDVARTLGKRTVAESVQDAKTVELLTASGVDFMQGYYLGEPSARLTARPLRAVS